MFSDPYISFFHLLVNDFCVANFRNFFDDPFMLVGGIGRQRGNKMALASTPSAANDLILIHIVQIKPMIKAHISGRILSSGTSDVVFASVL